MTLARLNNGKNTLICIVIFSWICQVFVKFFEDLEPKKNYIITHEVTQASFCFKPFFWLLFMSKQCIISFKKKSSLSD